MTYGGLDYLALHTHRQRNTIYSLGNQIGVGKESDVYITASASGRQQILKLHRLGRISFRAVKSKRDYLRNRTSGSWMYLSRLAAQKEHAFMQVLHREGFPVPEPIAWCRHTVVMEFIDSFPLRMIEHIPHPGKLYAELMDIIVSLAKRSLIHGDFNEFNILIREQVNETTGEVTLQPIVIDFPQTVSTNHANAEMYFDRDVECIRRYFERRFKYTSDEPGPFFEDAIRGADLDRRLDVEVEASGFSKKMAKELERFVDPGNASKDETDDVSDDNETPDDDGETADIQEGSEEAPEEGSSELELAEQLDSISVTDGLAVKPLTAADYGLLPLELSHDRDVVAEKVHTKKKAAGWAI